MFSSNMVDYFVLTATEQGYTFLCVMLNVKLLVVKGANMVSNYFFCEMVCIMSKKAQQNVSNDVL